MGESSRVKPPPVPRRHPSRATLRGNSQSASSDAESTFSTSADSQVSAGSSAAAASDQSSVPSRPNSAIYLGPAQSQTTDLASRASISGPNLIVPARRRNGEQRRGSSPGTANGVNGSSGQISPVLVPGLTFAGKVGLGSPKLDFHDWAKAGRPSDRDASRSPRSPAEEPERAVVDDVTGLPSPPGTDIAKENEPATESNGNNIMSSASTPTIAADATPMTKRPSTLSRPLSHRSSPSVSPRPGFRPNSSLAESQSGSSSKRGSTDSLTALRRQQAAEVTSPRSNGSSSPDKTLQRIHISPAERRRAKRASVTATSEADVENVDQADDDEFARHERRRSSGTDLDEKIREAEEKIAKRTSYKKSPSLQSPIVQSPSVRKWQSPRTTPNGRAVEQDDIDRSGGSSGSGRRKPIPNDFRNGELFTPSPKPSDGPLSSHSSRVQEVSSASPLRSRYSSVRQESQDRELSSPSRTLSRARIEGLDRGSADLSSPRRRMAESISGLSRHESLRRDRPRPESVLVTPSDQYRYRREETLERELSGLRIGLTPNDSVSAVGSGSREKEGKRDPLDIIRRLEEQRAQHNRRWEEDRAGSVMGDRQQQRPSSRLDRTPHHPRPTSSMSSVRDAYLAGARTAPHDMQSRRRDMGDRVMESPLTGRSSRMGGITQEPRQLRASTSVGGRMSAGSTYELPDPSSDHGRILLEAFRALDVKLADPELARVFHASTRTTETLSSLVRIASGLASDLAIGLEIDEPARLRDNATRLTMALRDAARSADQNVRDLTQVMLELPRHLSSGGTNGASGGGGGGGSLLRSTRRSESSIEPFKADRWSNDQPRWSTDSGPSPFRVERPSTSMGGIYSPSSRFTQQFSSGVSGVSELGRSSSLSHTSHASLSSRRGYEPPLQTIQASPPKPTHSMFNTSTSGNYSNNSKGLSYSPVQNAPPPPPPRSPERTLRHKLSTTSTQTLRGNSNPNGMSPASSFLPATSAGTTTALSAVTMIDPEVSPPATTRSPRFPNRSDASTRAAAAAAAGMTDSSDGDSFVSFGSGSGHNAEDATANMLALAAKERELGRVSVSERFREHLRRNSRDD